ncbi:amyloid fiber anchoring/assembly protein TapA [Bacillus sp. FJAT-47783]|uniref:amyloid fiber anchoring/assembly protein TapA n=1 Tax=Bacillus sp. FJAT-47783 TaxID=2922712 RepID=UPI00325FDA2A
MVIRYRRKQKYKGTDKKWFIGFQLFSLLYLLLLIGVFQLSFTNAEFTDVERTSGTISICSNYHPDKGCHEKEENQWDKSSLTFTDQKWNEPNVEAVIQNGADSDDMEGATTYEVYYTEVVNPKNGTVIASGEVPALKSGETITLSVDVKNRKGIYMFKAYQRPGHKGIGELWSKEIIVQAKNEKTEEETKTSKEVEPSNNESQLKENTEQPKNETKASNEKAEKNNADVDNEQIEKQNNEQTVIEKNEESVKEKESEKQDSQVEESESKANQKEDWNSEETNAHGKANVNEKEESHETDSEQ